METKSAIQSKTIQGVVVMALVMLANKAGFAVDGTTLIGLMDEIVGLAGTIWAVYGRIVATHKLK